ncbi:hypothetical protein GCM10010378_09730 [Streptomyces viridochromogenes]
MRIRNCPATVYLCMSHALRQSEDLPTVRPGHPAGALRRPGLVEWAGGRDAPCARELPPALRKALCRARESLT